MMYVRLVACVGAIILTQASSAQALPAGFFGLRDWLDSTSITDDGRAYVTRPNRPDALWSPLGMAQLDTGAVRGVVSADGNYVAGSGGGGAFRYQIATRTRQNLPPLPGGSNIIVEGVSANGLAVVGTDTGGQYKAWRWTQSTGSMALTDGFTFSQAFGASADGRISLGRAATRPFIHEEGQPLRVLDPFQSAEVTEFRAISRDNQVIVGAAWTGGSNNRTGAAFRWSSGDGYQSLGSVGVIPGWNDQSYTPLGVNADGSVIVGTQGARRAWIWDSAHGMRDLRDVLTRQYGYDLSGWTLETATGISANGRFLCGSGVYLNGNAYESHAWMAVIPAPGATTLFLCTCMTMTVRRRR